MPYIKPHIRLNLARHPFHKPQDAGQLNYAITVECLSFLGGAPTYSDYNEVIGALECCKLEFYRRAVAPYEDKKIIENGDVYL